MADITATFEAGTNGSTILAADTGAATAWDVVTINSGTLTYDNSQAYETLSAKLDGAGVKTMAWTTAFADTSEHYGRFYLYRADNPASHIVLCTPQIFAVSYGGKIDLNTDGTLRLMDQSGAVRATTTNSIALNQWVRIEFHFIHSATVGQLEVKLFNSPDSTSPTETCATTAAWDFNTSADSILFGAVEGHPASSTWFDNILAGAASYPGPVGVAKPVQVLSMQSHVFGHNMW